VQVEDTHAHAPYSKCYKRQETEDAYEQLQVRPDKLPSTSRQTVMNRALSAWSQVDHTSCSHGFVANGITNALDGSEDVELSEDVLSFWHELKMSEVREAMRAEVAEAVHGGLSNFEDYHRILEAYPTHAAMLEGQEAFGVEIGEQGDLASDAGSATDHEVTLENEEDMRGDVDFRDMDCGRHNTTASSHAHQSATVALLRLQDDGTSEVVAAAAPTSADAESGKDHEHVPSAAFSIIDRGVSLALSHVKCPIEDEDEPTRQARTSLQSETQQKYDATHAALEAAKTVGGDKQLVDTLQQRLKSLSRQFRACGDRGRLRIRVLRMHQKTRAKKLRAESVAQENHTKELRLEVKLREAEAVKAREKGREAAAVARKEAEEAKIRAKQEACRIAEQNEAQSHIRSKFAAKLCGEHRAYMGALSQGPERTARATRLAVAGAARREGLKVLPVPDFWPTTTAGFMKVKVPSARGGAFHEVMWASPDFAWMLFGGVQPKTGDPTHVLYKLIGNLMPRYFDLLGSRYGIEGLLAQSHRVLDVAFMMASWRYTKIVGLEFYRCGLHVWPPVPGWEESSLCAEKSEPLVVPMVPRRVAASSHGRTSTASRTARKAPRRKPRSPAVEVAGDGKAAAMWEIAADGGKVHTEAGCRHVLRKHGYIVQPSSAHGANQCLIDSVILALSHAGIAEADISISSRAAICSRVREHLVKFHGASHDGYLAHDEQVQAVFEYLRSHELALWRAGVHPERIECTVTVFDRFSCRVELAPTDPVFIPAPIAEASSHEVQHVQLALYACTSLNGLGYHYEWIHGAP